ncbi:MAG: hypothetical protein ISP67_03400 [Flavobacteriaceae bacterium]|nr:hypothetical protein [Flavobacteriaceae bacterium]
MKKGHFEHHEQLDFIGCMERLIDYAVDGIQDNSGREKTQLYKLGESLKGIMRQHRDNKSSLGQTNEDAFLIDKANYFIQQLYQFVPGENLYISELTQKLKKENKKLKKLTNLLQQEKKQKKMKKYNRINTSSEEEYNLLKLFQDEYNALKRRNNWKDRKEFLLYMLEKEVGKDGDSSYSARDKGKFGGFYEKENNDREKSEKKTKAENEATGKTPTHDDILFNSKGDFKYKGFDYEEEDKSDKNDKGGYFTSLGFQVNLEQRKSAYAEACKYFEEGYTFLRQAAASDYDFEDKSKEQREEGSREYIMKQAINRFSKCLDILAFHGLAGNTSQPNEGTAQEDKLYRKAENRITYLKANMPKKKSESLLDWLFRKKK